MTLVEWLRQWARGLSWLEAEDGDEAAYRAVGELLPPFVQTPIPPEVFADWERKGFHLTANHFYSPIPEASTLPNEVWEPRRQSTGIDFNDQVALELLTRHFPVFRSEYSRLPRHRADSSRNEFQLDNPAFTGTDALVLYCMLRHFRPARVVEVGCGHSSLLAGQAANRNGSTELICVEPHSPPWLRRGFLGLSELVEKPVQEVPLELFTALRENDVLLIDGSHVAKIGSDVVFVFLEVLPRLAPGVIVHVHDIFLPDDYPRQWVVDLHYFWNEQYLLHAYLLGNDGVEVLFGNSYMERNYPDEMRRTFPDSPWWGGGGFWMRTRRRLAPRNG